jgi:hypothetical protein
MIAATLMAAHQLWGDYQPPRLHWCKATFSSSATKLNASDNGNHHWLSKLRAALYGHIWG